MKQYIVKLAYKAGRFSITQGPGPFYEEAIEKHFQNVKLGRQPRVKTCKRYLLNEFEPIHRRIELCIYFSIIIFLELIPPTGTEPSSAILIRERKFNFSYY